MVFKKICPDCKEMFQPTGKYQKLCEECKYKRFKLRGLKIKAWKKKLN